MHGAPDVNHWHLTTFESHDPASMGKLLIPCDIIMYAFMAGDGHGAVGLFLVTGYSMLDSGYWSPLTVAGYALRVAW